MTDRELMQQALEAMGTVGADWICEASHHAKKDQHKWGEPCPLQQRWHIAYQALRERLAQPEQDAVLAEREACAALVDANAMACHSPIYRSLLQSNADAIRARGKDPMPLFDDWGGLK